MSALARKLLAVLGYIALGAFLIVSLGIVGKNDFEVERETGSRSIDEVIR